MAADPAGEAQPETGRNNALMLQCKGADFMKWTFTDKTDNYGHISVRSRSIV